MRIFSLISCLCLVLIGHGQSYPSTTWRKFVKNCKVGFVDPEGRVMIEPNFENASEFSEGKAFVSFDTTHEKNKDSLALISRDLYLNNRKNYKTGIIDSTGKFIVHPKANFSLYAPYKNNVALVVIDDSLHPIDQNGNLISKEQVNDLISAHHSTLFVGQYDPISHQKCYLNVKGEMVYGPFEACYPFNQNLGRVKLGGKYGYLNCEGHLAIIPQFIQAGDFSEGLATVAVTINEETLFGVIDTVGRFVIPPEYHYLGPPSEGHIAYAKRGADEEKYGFINLKNQVIIEAQYSFVADFSNGLALIKNKGKYGYINQQGEVVIATKFTNAESFKNGTALISKGKRKRALINTKGQIIYGFREEKCN